VISALQKAAFSVRKDGTSNTVSVRIALTLWDVSMEGVPMMRGARLALLATTSKEKLVATVRPHWLAVSSVQTEVRAQNVSVHSCKWTRHQTNALVTETHPICTEVARVVVYAMRATGLPSRGANYAKI